MTKARIQLIAGTLALLLLLLYNFVHTGQLLAGYVEWPVVGFLAAAGIEVSVVALSIQIGRRKTSRQDATFFYAVLLAVVGVSALANASMGFLHKYGRALTVADLPSIDIVQGVVDLSATALISFIVLSLAEILGQDVQTLTDAAGQAIKCPHCSFAAEWPTDKYPTKRSAQSAVAGHKRSHDKPAEAGSKSKTLLEQLRWWWSQ